MTDFGAPAYTMATTTPYPTTTPGLPSGGGGGTQAGQDGGGDGGYGDLPVDLVLVVQGSLAALTAGKLVAVMARRGIKYAWDRALKGLRKAREARALDNSQAKVEDVESCCPPRFKFGWQLRIKVELLQFASGENFPTEEEDSRAGFGTVALCSSCNNTGRLEDTVFVAKKGKGNNNSTVLGCAGQKSRSRLHSTPRNGVNRFSDVEEEEAMEVDEPDGDGWANVRLDVPDQKRPRPQ
jgi:hypothetical protein